jgi:hypothetical protein
MLRASAQAVHLLARWAQHSAMQIVTADPRAQIVAAAADPRTVGAALAF